MTTLLSLWLMAWCSLAAADCVSNTRASPTAVGDTVANQYAEFEWRSALGPQDGEMWISNFIFNLAKAGLGVSWEKGKIYTSLLNPLAAGRPFCIRYIVNVQATLDKDAPIIYGTNEQRQNAAAYVERLRKGEATRSVIETTVEDDGGKTRLVEVSFSTTSKDDVVELLLDRPSDLIVGFSRLPRVLSAAQIKSIVADLGKQDTKVEIATVREFVDPKLLNVSFVGNDLKSRLGEKYMFLSGRGKNFFQVRGGSAEEQEADMIVLDKNRRPLFVASVTMFAPP
jgi:hypothetical protein